MPRTPLDRGRCCWVPLYLLILFPQPLLGLLPPNSVSPSSALGIPGGAQTGGLSIHLWPPHPVPCPAWHSTGHTHCSALVPRGTRAAHPASSTSFLAFTFSGAASVRDPRTLVSALGTADSQGRDRARGEASVCQGSYLDPVDHVFDRGAVGIVGCVHVQPCLQRNISQLSFPPSGWERGWQLPGVSQSSHC